MRKRWLVLAGFLLLLFGFRQIDGPVAYQFPELAFFPAMPLSPNNPVTVEGVDLGRHLFYDPILSRDFTFSCASCHKQAAAFSDGSVTRSVGIDGVLTTRNTMPLFNLAWYPALFWDGKAASIEAQVFHPVRAHTEMDLAWSMAVERIAKSGLYRKKFQQAFPGQAIDSSLIAMAIAQFERTLLSNNSRYDRVLRGDDYFSPEEFKGFELVNDMTKGDCLHCHTTDADALGTTGEFSNNGLDTATNAASFIDAGRGAITGQSSDNAKFKVPSLRNLAFTAPYMHDGRFKTLEGVLDFYSEGVQQSVTVDSKMGAAHKGGVHLSAEEKSHIIAFLLTMTDTVFVNNPAFGNPF